MRGGYLFLVFAAVLLVFSCQDLNGCKEEKYSSAIVSDFPDSLQAGTDYELKVEYIVENSCGEFLEFEENTSGDTVEVQVKLNYEGCSCNLQFEQKEGAYTLHQDSSGMYQYKFWVGENEYDSFYLEVFD